jgi:hypothetical protein
MPTAMGLPSKRCEKSITEIFVQGGSESMVLAIAQQIDQVLCAFQHPPISAIE